MILADTFDPKASGTVDWKNVPVELLAAEAANGDKDAIAEVARRSGLGGNRPRPALVVEGKRADVHPFNADQHPRDKHGRFISIGAHIDLGGGRKGEVTHVGAGEVTVKQDDGKSVTVKGDAIKNATVTKGPSDGARAAAAASAPDRAPTADAPTAAAGAAHAPAAPAPAAAPDVPAAPEASPAAPSINVFHPGTYGGMQYLDEASNADEIQQQIEQAFGFQHAETGFRTKWKYDDSRSGSDRLELRGAIVDGDGNAIGVIERSVTRHPDGRVEVHHDLLKIQKDYQGQGFADALYRHALATYPSFGATEVSMEADIDVGAYAWAQRGFDWADDETARRVHSAAGGNLQSFLKSDAGKALDPAQTERVQALISHLDAARFGKAPALSPKELANSLSDITWTYTTIAGKDIKMWPGKEALLNRNAYWNAVLKLLDTPPPKG